MSLPKEEALWLEEQHEDFEYMISEARYIEAIEIADTLHEVGYEEEAEQMYESLPYNAQKHLGLVDVTD